MEIYDLSLPIEEGMVTFPVHWHPLVEVSQLGRHAVEGRETRKVVFGTHTGTHVDAPRHFIDGGTSIDCVPLDNFVGPARLLDFSNLPDLAPIDSDLLNEKLGSDPPGRLIFRYGWDKNLLHEKYYKGHPFLTEDACNLLVDLGTKLVGFDAPMPDDPRNGRGADKDSPNHKILLSGGISILEYLCNLDLIPTPDFYLIALPLRFSGADGSPVRAVALVNKESCASN